MKKILFCCSLLVGLHVHAQEIKKTSASAVPSNTVYFVDGKYTDSLALSTIKSNTIASVNVIKRDTIVNSRKYDAQIFVLLKKDSATVPPKSNK